MDKQQLPLSTLTIKYNSYNFLFRNIGFTTIISYIFEKCHYKAVYFSSLEQRVVRCHSCGFNNLNDNDDLPLEHHAKFNISCPNIQNDLDAEFIDLKSKKPEVCTSIIKMQCFCGKKNSY